MACHRPAFFLPMYICNCDSVIGTNCLPVTPCAKSCKRQPKLSKDVLHPCCAKWFCGSACMSVFVTVWKATLIHVATSMLPVAECALARARCSVKHLLRSAKIRASRTWSNQVMPPGTTTTG
eukprot:6781744-Prorocentrum_lima.AAC.1